MKLRVSSLALVIICFITGMSLIAAAPQTGLGSGQPVTIGEFAVQLASALNTSSGEISTIDDARKFFAGQGIAIPSDMDLSSTLTQKDVSRFASLMGLNVSPEKPDAAFTSESVEGFVYYVRDEVLAGGEQDSLSTQGLTAVDAARTAPAGLGACCVGTSCIGPVGAAYCSFLGGVYRGAGIACTPDPCFVGAGTCCLDRLGPCIITDQTTCEQTPGARFRGTQVCTKKTCSREVESPVEP